MTRSEAHRRTSHAALCKGLPRLSDDQIYEIVQFLRGTKFPMDKLAARAAERILSARMMGQPVPANPFVEG